MRKAALHMMFTLCFMLTGCSGTSGSISESISESQNAHLLSVNVEVIEKIENDNITYRVQALESCSNEIKSGDVILVTTEIPEIYDIFEAYHESNRFRIYFPKVDKAADCISVTCFDIVQYDSSNEVLRYIEPK